MKIPVSFPDFRQLCLFSEWVRIVRTVFDGVGLKWVRMLRLCWPLQASAHLVPGVVADGANVDVEGGADHLAVWVLQHMGGVHSLRLIVILQKVKLSEGFMNSICQVTWIVFDDINLNSMILPCKTHNRLEVFWSSLSFSCWRMIWKLGEHSQTCWEAALRLGSLNS